MDFREPSSSGLHQGQLHVHEPDLGNAQPTVHQALHKNERIQVAVVGIDPGEYGRLIAESQRQLSESENRAQQFEGLSKEIYQQACSRINHLTMLVEELKGNVEGLQMKCVEKDSTIASLHESVEHTKKSLEDQIRCNQAMFTKGSPLGDTLSLTCEASVGESGSNN